MSTPPVTATAVAAPRRAGRRGAGRRIGVSRVLGAACLVLALAPATRAGADGLLVPAERCTPGWVCGWTGPAYTGVVSLVALDMPRYPETTAYVGFNDGASVWNGAGTWRVEGAPWGRCVTVYNQAGYTGRSLTVAPGQGVEQLAASFGHIRSGRFHTCRLS
ncbi:peptidase inhibitor family I36 protein [Streptomyces sp. NPDC102278]|uniref:peptidase inhibitor family I36 protein n=1 Tax=Streptomyces sp. NPDC102278 TaxID=3366152 RepID=UPI00380A199D